MNTKLDFHLQGAPNFRVADLNVYGVAQPTVRHYRRQKPCYIKRDLGYWFIHCTGFIKLPSQEQHQGIMHMVSGIVRVLKLRACTETAGRFLTREEPLSK